MTALLLLARIRWRRDGTPDVGHAPGLASALRAIPRAWHDTVGILRRDRPFRTYEVAFMFYGLGLLSSIPLVVLFAEGELGLSYSQWANAQGVAFPIGFIVGMAVFGRLTDRFGPVRIACVAFVLLAVFFGVVPFAASSWAFAGAFLLYGVAMAGVHAGWALGPLYFAPPGRARSYTSAHVCLVGARSGVGPVVGYALAVTVGLRFAFTVSAVLVAAGAVTLVFLLRADGATGTAGLRPAS